MRFLLIVLSVFIVVFSFSVTAFNVHVDGIDSGVEWEGSDYINLVDGESNCNVINGGAKYIVDDENSSVYLYFIFNESDFDADSSNMGISVSADSVEYFDTYYRNQQSYDTDKYRIETALSVEPTSGTVCEIRLGMKYGVPSGMQCFVRFIDSQGSFSNVYTFVIDNEEEVVYYPYEPDLPKSTKQKTTKPSTTKKTTTEQAEIKTETTAKKDETDSTKKYGTPLLDILLPDFDDETTEETVTEKNKTTTKKQTKKPKTTKAATNSETDSLTTLPSSTNSVSETETEETKTDKISTSEGSRYKTITAVAGGIAVVAVAVFGSIGANKKNIKS